MESLPPAYAIEASPGYLDCLRRLVDTKEHLKSMGYVVDPLTEEDLNAKRRCVNCGKRPKPRKPRKNGKKCDASNAKNDLAKENHSDAGEGDADAPEKSGDAGSRLEEKEKNNFPCQFHPGYVQFKFWTCCKQHVSVKKPCAGEREHKLQIYPNGALEKRWAYYPTPAMPTPTPSPAGTMPVTFDHARSNSQGQARNRRRRGHHRGAQSETSAANVQQRQPRLAVALDCEMGTAEDSETELIRLTLIDYFSGAVLVDSLVVPSVPMAHYNTRFSGVTRWQMQKAEREGTCIRGLHAAREQVWRHVGPDTIVVGHGASSDLSSLRWMHHCMIDTYLVEYQQQKRRRAEEEKIEAREEAEGRVGDEGGERKEGEEEREEMGEEKEAQQESAAPGTGEAATKKNVPKEPLSLKALTLRRLGRHIQIRTQKGHDSLEDAIATRDLVDWHVKQALDAQNEETAQA